MKRQSVGWIILAAMTPLLTGSLCGDDSSSGPDDITPPAAVENLAADATGSTSILLSWTAPGDDGSTGMATTYDLRYAPAVITEDSWPSATEIAATISPRRGGESEEFTVNGLSAGTRYYFALKTADEIPLWSELSNAATAVTDTVSEEDEAEAAALEAEGYELLLKAVTWYATPVAWGGGGRNFTGITLEDIDWPPTTTHGRYAILAADSTTFRFRATSTRIGLIIEFYYEAPSHEVEITYITTGAPMPPAAPQRKRITRLSEWRGP